MFFPYGVERVLSIRCRFHDEERRKLSFMKLRMLSSSSTMRMTFPFVFSSAEVVSLSGRSAWLNGLFPLAIISSILRGMVNTKVLAG